MTVDTDERYRAFIENSTEGIWRVDTDGPVPTSLPEDEQVEAFYRFGYLAEANDAFARMYGFEQAEQLIGTRLGDLLVRENPANDDYLRAFIRSGYRLSDAVSVETDREGRTRRFANTLTGVVEKGRLVRAWGMQRDVTAQHEAEQRLRESEERFHALADNIAQLAWMAEPSGAIFWYNQRWFEYTGTTMEQMRGWGWRSVHAPDQVEQVAEKFRAHVEAGQPWEDTFPLRGADGTFRWFLSRAFPTRDAAGNIVLWCGTNTDITEQRQAAARQRAFLREVLYSLTEGRLLLCDTDADLPAPLPSTCEPVLLTESALRVLRKQVQVTAEQLGFPREKTHDLLTAVGEAAMNAVRHARNGASQVHADTHRGRAQVWIRDEGAGIAAHQIHRVLERGWTTGGFGHGFWYMLKTVDTIYLITGPTGTTIVLEMERETNILPWLQTVGG